MKPRCIAAVGSAIGRPLNVAEIRTIESRIADAMRSEARRDPAAWQMLPLADQLKQAAAVAGKEIVAEANLKKFRIAKQVEAFDRAENYIESQVASGIDATKLDALDRMLAAKNDGKNNIISIESNTHGIEATAFGRLVATWEAISPKFMGLWKNKEVEEAFILEAHGVDTGIPEMKRAVQAWRDVTDGLRERFNAAGGAVGKLDNWGMPHSWSQKLVVEMGQGTFVDRFMKWIDRSQYVHEDGRVYSDVEMQEFLSQAWLTIATDGANKIKNEPLPGGAVKASRNAQSRQIHFRDGAAALEAYQTLTEGNLFQTLFSHVKRMSRDIAIVEQLGPNADHAFEALLNQSYREASESSPKSLTEFRDKAKRLVNLYDYVAGNSPAPVENWLYRSGGDLRAVISAAKLGSATISSIADEGTLYLTAHVNKLPLVQVFLNELKALNPLDHAEKAMAMRAGLMVKTMMGDMNRFGSDALGNRWSQQVSNLFMKMSGLEKLTETRRRAFSVTVMDSLGSLTRRIDDVAKLTQDDAGFLASKGIDQATWQIWRQAQPESWGGNHTVLTPESIMRVPGIDKIERERAASKLLAITLEEQNVAVIEPGARERAGTASISAGTFQGELLRSLFLFKSFPHAMIERHVQRGLGAYDGWQGKAGYLATLVALQTLFGAISLEINDVLSGRDPRNLNPAEKFGMRNWLAAVLKGGALGVYGDFLFDESGASGRSPVETMAGPVAGTIAAGIALTQGNAVQFLRGEDTHAGAELVKFLRGITPGSNIWYTKAAVDHLIFQNMQEYFSPGYLADMRAKAQEKAGTTWWWKPGRPIDEARAPNIANVAGVKQ